MFPLPRFQGTPPAPAGTTGLFDREGLERRANDPAASKPVSTVQRPCGRCGGIGGGDQWKHTGWTCFDCNGSGKGRPKVLPLYTEEKLAKLNATRDKSRAKKAAERQAEHEAREVLNAEKRRQRASILALDPFFLSFQTLMGTFCQDRIDSGDGYRENPQDTRPLVPEFLRQMYEEIQVQDLTETQRNAIQKFISIQKDRVERQETSRFIGEVGARVEITAKVVFVKELEPFNRGYSDSRFGARRFIIKFETTDHQTLTWFTGKALEKGSVCTGKATIKGHKTFQNIRETQISNFRITGDETGQTDLLEGVSNGR